MVSKYMQVVCKNSSHVHEVVSKYFWKYII